MNKFAVTLMLIFLILLAGSVTYYTFSKCGYRAFLYGNGATFAAVSGMCDK